MANIPIENVPNAPKTGGMGMAGANWRPRSLAAVTRGGTPNYSKAINSTGAVLHPYLQSVAKMNMRAGAQLGGAVQQVGSELSKINDQLNAAENLGQGAKLENMIKEERIAFAEDTLGMPLEEKQNAWNARHKDFNGKIAGMNLSSVIAQKAGIASEAFNQEQQIGIRTQALSERNQENKVEILKLAEADFIEGNWLGYVGVMREGEKAGYIQKGSLDGPNGLFAKRKQEFDENEVVAMAYKDPQGTKAYFNTKNADGTPMHYPEMDEDRRASIERKLTLFDNRRVNESLKAIYSDYSNDPTKSLALIDSMVKVDDISREKGKYHRQELLRLNPAPLDIPLYLGVKRAINEIDLANDPEEINLREIQDKIGTINHIPSRKKLVAKLQEALGDAADNKTSDFKYGESLLYAKADFKAAERKANAKLMNETITFQEQMAETKARQDDHDWYEGWKRKHPDADRLEIEKAVNEHLTEPSIKEGKSGLDFKASELPMGAGGKTSQAKELIKGEVINRASGMRTEHGSDAETTAYFPGSSDQVSRAGLTPIEGGVLDAHDNVIIGQSTYEDYMGGRGKGYVTVAMDKDSAWAKDQQFLMSPSHPLVVFKVMDNGSRGNGITDKSWVDIAFTDPKKAKNYKRNGVRFEPITPSQADEVWAAYTKDTVENLSGTWEEAQQNYFKTPRVKGEVDEGLALFRLRWENSADLVEQQSTTEYLPKDGSKKLDEEKQLNQDYVKLDLPAGSGLPTENSLFPKK